MKSTLLSTVEGAIQHLARAVVDSPPVSTYSARVAISSALGRANIASYLTLPSSSLRSVSDLQLSRLCAFGFCQ